MDFLKNSALGLLIIIAITSCSSTESVTTPGADSGSIFPEWYDESGFASDSVYYSAFATAISSDSTLSIKRAEDQARANLESRISEKMEVVRIELEENGIEYAKNADFILTLRNAHAPVVSEAELIESIASKNENRYRGFAKVSISVDQLRTILQAGFAGKASFWTDIQKLNNF